LNPQLDITVEESFLANKQVEAFPVKSDKVQSEHICYRPDTRSYVRISGKDLQTCLQVALHFPVVTRNGFWLQPLSIQGLVEPQPVPVASITTIPCKLMPRIRTSKTNAIWTPERYQSVA